eukprot:scaffold6327_cov61-Phaeocystis_antarctica.AAC.6
MSALERSLSRPAVSSKPSSSTTSEGTLLSGAKVRLPSAVARRLARLLHDLLSGCCPFRAKPKPLRQEESPSCTSWTMPLRKAMSIGVVASCASGETSPAAETGPGLLAYPLAASLVAECKQARIVAAPGIGLVLERPQHVHQLEQRLPQLTVPGGAKARGLGTAFDHAAARWICVELDATSLSVEQDGSHSGAQVTIGPVAKGSAAGTVGAGGESVGDGRDVAGRGIGGDEALDEATC